jgi:hypothetical protein
MRLIEQRNSSRCHERRRIWIAGLTSRRSDPQGIDLTHRERETLTSGDAELQIVVGGCER